ncbi:hypothetical protein [Aquimarina sp. AU474]|uniref:tetratricopeptide repeat-containing sensor histidine kinase n=1 Tax=Aquimarina sp. AU474 TaxID=2108529 RepID=UPI000D690F7A|nr:hypothetical protein [Aquimarina sp. AU474]
MKLWRVNFPFSIRIWGLISYISFSTFGQEKEKSSLTPIQLDSTYYYFKLSKEDSVPRNEKLKHINSFLSASKRFPHDSLLYIGLMRKTTLLGQLKKFDSAIVYSKKLLSVAEKNQDTSYMIKAYAKLGRYYKNNNQLAHAFKNYNESFKVSRILMDSIAAGKSLLQMANIQASLGDFSGSKTTAIDGIRYIENTTNVQTLSGLYHIISVANREQKNYEDALKYNDKAFEIDKSRNSIQVFKNTRANILSDQKEFKKAIDILQELMSDSTIQKSKSKYARVIDNYGYEMWLQDPENEDSEQLLLTAKDMREKTQDISGLIASNIHLTKYYLEKEDTKALLYAEAAYENAKKRRSLTSVIEALEFVFKLKDNIKEEALEYDRVHKELQTINQSNREIYGVTKYENDKLTTENLVLRAETAKKERQRVIYLFGTIILILTGGFVFYFLEQRHKREIIRDVYNAEARISKKLHDELANDVYNVMIQIQNDQSNQDVLDKLEDIYNSTRDISRENSSFNEGRDFSQELNHMLSGYSGDYTKIIIKDIDEIAWQSITPEKKIIVHRVLQELMINMKKHSDASLVAVTFKKSPKQIKITYADNGLGVDKEGIMYSNGLRNAENRIKTIGGSFIFESEIGKGFKASLCFPN